MIKGCEKKIIYLKDTKSEYFEEAYFVVKPQASGEKECDIILEATRIVNGIYDGERKKKNIFAKAIPFFIGFGLSSLLFVVGILIF